MLLSARRGARDSSAAPHGGSAAPTVVVVRAESRMKQRNCRSWICTKLRATVRQADDPYLVNKCNRILSLTGYRSGSGFFSAVTVLRRTWRKAILLSLSALTKTSVSPSRKCGSSSSACCCRSHAQIPELLRARGNTNMLFDVI